MKHFHLILFLWAAIVTNISAQSKFHKQQFITTNSDTLQYQVLEPTNYIQSKNYPLLIFLHGAGERGSDNIKQLTHGAGMFENPINQDKYPAFVLFPQCPESKYWAYEERPKSFNPDSMPITELPTPIIQDLHELILAYRNKPQIDSTRIYIVGLSMGAMATYDMVIRYPELFAAAVPICGTVNPRRLKKAHTVPMRIFHGDADSVVPVEASRKAFLTLKKNHAHVEYKEYPSVNHGSWVNAFNEPDFLEWIFKHHQKSCNK